jgi:hypothetical protein
MNALRRRFLLCLLVAAHTLIGCDEPFQEEHKKFASVVKGMSEQDVTQRLGEPYRMYTAADAPSNYYVEGYAREERPISGKVLIYMGTDSIAYVYIDKTGKVEHVFVGGS